MGSIDDLVDFIVRAENGGRLDWDAVYGGIPRSARPNVPVTSMTVAQVQAWQQSVRGKYRSTAVGGPQFLYSTLQGLVARGIASPSQVFDADTQRRLAIALMAGRGLNDYLMGRLSAESFALELAKEWASLPIPTGPKAGFSYYAGDGLNKALVSVTDFMAAVRAVKPPPATSAPRPLWRIIIDWLKGA